MGIAIANVRFEVRVRHTGFPGQWDVTVTNASSFTTSYIPLMVMVESEHIELDGVELITDQNSQLQPGGSIEYLLKLKREGFAQPDGWTAVDFDSSEKLVLLLKHLGPGANPDLAVVELPAYGAPASTTSK